MNEQEAQKAAFEKWDDLNKNSLSIDHKNGHEQGWDDALEWVKRGQKPVAEVLYGFILDSSKQIIEASGEESLPICQKLYRHPTPQPDVADLVRAFDKLIDAACECQNWQCFPVMALEEAQDALAKWEAKK